MSRIVVSNVTLRGSVGLDITGRTLPELAAIRLSPTEHTTIGYTAPQVSTYLLTQPAISSTCRTHSN